MVAIWCHNGCMRTKKTEQKLTVRFSPDLLDELRVLAQKHKRSLNSEILWGLQVYVNDCKEGSDEEPYDYDPYQEMIAEERKEP